MLKFNSKGLLTPNNNIPCDLDNFKEEFVLNINSNTRTSLFNNYIGYSKALKELVSGQPLLQWIDGSFVTKKPDPEDIDIVTFINSEFLNPLGTNIDSFKYPDSLAQFGVDAYIVKIYTREDKRYPLYVGDQLYWMDKFDKTRRNRNGIKSSKGFIEIIY
ncbi:hypothetical protein BDE36_1103 [Arcticibacter tournemirensis]|uniref:Uncharacterized protein n=1 Tax=Arcticibacter tournemirensis TaxID=699437 RepID=A0A5M9GH13_9SPHI|nr:hypothetical protein [Arcticibacter tournemirensis]KAA8473912.1 hypothetical protein F1649_22510 [Arcticibacter tournemirensis]TQM49400.1 hypothetical protein BDE36_1103 [Arcticibacter tournemirensis]